MKFSFPLENLDEAVGFSAYSTVTRTFDDEDIVIFDEVLSNFGQYFDLESNIFVCPFNGIYWLSVS